jgi:hypothetical protein
MTSIRDKVLFTEGNAALEKIKEVEDSQSMTSENENFESEKYASFLNTEENKFLKHPIKSANTLRSGI